MRNLYVKLGTHRRAEAVERARDGDSPVAADAPCEPTAVGGTGRAGGGKLAQVADSELPIVQDACGGLELSLDQLEARRRRAVGTARLALERMGGDVISATGQHSEALMAGAVAK
jgi:hypothetical protein